MTQTGSGMLTAMVIVVLFSGIVQGYLTPLLPALGSELHIGSVGQTNIYLLAQLSFAVMTPLLSRLGDLYGHRRLLLAALTTVAAGSLLMAALPTTVTLAVGVVLQGCVVGFFPFLAGILKHRAPERNRSGIALLVGVLLVAIGVGGLVAGMLSEGHAKAGLWTAVPIGLLALCAGLLLPDGGSARSGRFPLVPAVLLTIGLGSVVLVLTRGGEWGWSAPLSVCTAAGGAAALVGWVFVERRAKHPLVSLRLLSNRRLAVVSGCTFCAAFGTIGFLGSNATFLDTSPTQAHYGMGLGPRTIAAVALAVVIAGFVSSTLTPRLTRLVGDRAVLASAGLLTAAGFTSMAIFHETLGQYLAGALVVGLATGLFESITRTLSSEVVDDDQTALAVGINELSLSLGAAIGAAVISAVLAAHPAPGTNHVQLSGYLWAWTACALLGVLGGALALCYRRPAPGGAPRRLAAAGQRAGT
ncbi:MFS transporter [Bounagaea algeriensis]